MSEKQIMRTSNSKKCRISAWVIQNMTRLPDQLEFAEGDDTWRMGTDKAYLIELLKYWRTEFNWR